MPYLDSSAPADPVAQQWHTFFKAAFQRCLQGDQLATPLTELTRTAQPPPDEIANILMGFRARGGGFDVSLIFQYAKLLLRTKCVGASDMLLALLKSSYIGSPNGKAKPENDGTGLPTCEERMFSLMTQMYLTGELVVNPRESHRVVSAVVRWMRAVVELETANQMESAGLHTPDTLTCGIYEALGSLALTILSQPGIRVFTKLKWWKERRQQVVNEMENFDMNILQWMQSQLSGRLRALTKMPPFMETDDKGRPVFTQQQILESVADLPITRCRAGIYVWMNACLCGRPLTDDMSMLQYLQARYPGDNQTLAVDLLGAAFDTLTNALLRKDPIQTVKEIRSFICNKLPLLLSMISGYIAPLTVEACIQMAFMGITMDVLPPISAGSTDLREMLKKTRLEFLQASLLHGLVSESAITAIIQEPAPPMPRVTKLSKDSLVAQCNNNIGRLETIVEDLQLLNGNAGAIATCVLEVLNNLCINKDTMSLKSVCNTLIRRVTDMDIIMQYTQPANLLMPLCSILNEWVHDQDQTEFTPSYEEFASILLFTLMVIHRYGLDKADLGIADNDSFVSHLLLRISESTPPSELTGEQSEQLSKWVEGLFSTDDHGEIGGIGDEVMRQCPPRAFYLLVPTLFEQSVIACKSNALSVKTFKGGLELLLEPFLLPSLVGGLSWLVKHSWEDHGDVDILLQVLDKLLKPSSSSQETQAMHRAVLGIVASPLTQSLEELLRKRPDKKLANASIELLKPYIGRQRSNHRNKTEAAEWASSTAGGLSRSVRSAIREMIMWMSSIGSNPPTKYTHSMFTTACQVLGPNIVLAAIVDELKEQTAIGNGPTALDICTAMICAPTARTATPALALGAPAAQGQNAQLSPLDSLRLIVSDTQRLLSRPVVDAEALLNLSRRVEAQLAMPQMPQFTLPVQTQDQAADEIMKDLGFADVAGPSGGADGTAANVMDPTSTTDFGNAADMNALGDLTNAANQDLNNMASNTDGMQMDDTQNFFDDLTMDMNTAAAGMGDMGGDQEEDIFAGLDMGDLGDDFTFT